MSFISRAITSILKETGLTCYLTRWLTSDALKCFAVAGTPKASMGATTPVLDKIKDKSRGMGLFFF